MRLKHFFFILVAWLLVLIVVIGMAVEQKPLLYGLQAMVAGLILYLAFFYRKVVKPMNTIGHGMELLREQDFGSRLLPVKQREADRIVEIFNRMMEQLKEERLRLREQNNFLDLLINASPMGVIILSLDEEITMTNPAVYKLFGYDPADADELKGRFQGKRLDALE
ncbi:MAG TPA: PAS domain-containing sensor histidine kinase, partial [Porphyromonadaceae bacterium]|nr:PAS domain-containing sensor histidine kinase [Porphyromonadaceae bacterium]